MCGGGGGGHPHGQTYTYPVRGGFRGWTPGTGPGRGKITGRRPAIDLEAHPMCIMTPSGGPGAQSWGHPHSKAHRHYGRQARKGGWMFDRAGALIARLGAHPPGDVVAGRMRARDWVRYQLHPGDHAPDCRWRRACARIGWA